MERRKAIRIAAAAMATGAAGAVALGKAFKPEVKPAPEPKALVPEDRETAWKYHALDPVTTAELAYRFYPEGSCMYGVFKSIINQLADQIGEPYSSFPTHMMRYGHGGVNGNGTICGALNGAAAIIGLLVDGKATQDALAAELFHHYENTPLPAFLPAQPAFDFEPPTSEANSVLCHASTTRWSNEAGFRIDSKERKERCRRLTADVAAQTVSILNSYFAHEFIANSHDNETVRTCMTCHGSEGKVANTSGKMDCDACHPKSLGHRVFGNAHYKFMKEQ